MCLRTPPPGRWDTEVRVRQAVAMTDSHPTVTLDLWRSDAIVLFDWLMRTDLNALPVEHLRGLAPIGDSRYIEVFTTTKGS